MSFLLCSGSSLILLLAALSDVNDIPMKLSKGGALVSESPLDMDVAKIEVNRLFLI